MDFDNLTAEEKESFDYDSIFASVWYVYYTFVVSGRGYESFYLG